jgi:hypothetical protein
MNAVATDIAARIESLDVSLFGPIPSQSLIGDRFERHEPPKFVTGRSSNRRSFRLQDYFAVLGLALVG